MCAFSSKILDQLNCLSFSQVPVFHMNFYAFNHDWMIKFALAEYPPFSLLIFGLGSLQNSCATIFTSWLGG